MKSLLLNLLVLVATMALLVGAGELLLRAAPQQREGGVQDDGSLRYRFNPYRPDGALSYSLRPDWESVLVQEEFAVTVRTNSLGLRGKPARAEKTPGTLRILVVGDSFVFGLGVQEDEVFAARLETLLAERLGRPVEILNAGVPGWAADDYLVFLRTRGFALDPDVIVVGVMENDIPDLGWKRPELDDERLPVRTVSLMRAVDRNGRLRYLQKRGETGIPEAPFPEVEWLARHSALYHWLRFRVMKAWYAAAEERAAHERARAAGPPPEGPIASLDPEAIRRGLASGPAFRVAFHRHLAAGIEREARARGIPVYWIAIANRDSVPDAGLEVSALHDDCAALAERCLDTHTIFPADRKPEFFFANDGHWNAQGHARVADAVAEWLAPQLAR